MAPGTGSVGKTKSSGLVKAASRRLAYLPSSAFFS